jgi:hypothetical protein
MRLFAPIRWFFRELQVSDGHVRLPGVIRDTTRGRGRRDDHATMVWSSRRTRRGRPPDPTERRILVGAVFLIYLRNFDDTSG